MKLYYAKGACSLAVRILLNELNLPCYFESVNLATKKTETDADFLAINPKGSVPVLILDSGAILTENSAIQQYLADTHQAAALLPAVGDIKRYRVLEWLSFVSSDLHKNFGPLFNPAVPAEIKETLFIPLLKNKLQFLDNHLKHSNYLAGESFTLPDGYLFVVLNWLKHFDIRLTDYAAIAAYFDSLKVRPSIVEALKAEAITV